MKCRFDLSLAALKPFAFLMLMMCSTAIANAQSVTSGQTTQAIQQNSQEDKVFFSIDAAKLQTELNQLFQASSSSAGMTWGEVLSNGSNPGMDVDFNSFNISGVGNLTATGLLVIDSLNVAKVISGEVGSLANHTTTNLTEGDNLYFTEARAIEALSDTISYLLGLIAELQGDSIAAEPNFSCGSAFSYQGYDYGTAEIAGRCWFTENLRTELFADGNPIPELALAPEWEGTSTAARIPYNNDEEYNLPTYGYLYNWYAVDSAAGLCPSGWHVPTDEEFTALVDSLGGETAAGISLKASPMATNGWDGSISSQFAALPGGGRTDDGTYYDATSYAFFWSATENNFVDPVKAYYRILYTGYNGVNRSSTSPNRGFSVRCLKDADPVLGCTDPAYQEYNAEATQDDGSCVTLVAQGFTCGDPMAFAGYTYPTVPIDNQCLFAANLRTDEYANGDPISSTWDDPDVGQQMNHTQSNMGRVYNLAAVTESRNICPSGWHVWTYAEAQQVISHVGGISVAGVKLKASSDDDPNWNGTNDYGFSAVPNGIYSGGSIVLAGTYGYVWTAPSGPFTGFLRFSLFDAAELPDLNLGDEALGMSVRCALDEAP